MTEQLTRIPTWIVALPYGSRIDVRGEVRMGPQTAENVDAVLHRAKENPETFIFIPGEYTFGPHELSTSELMRDQLIKKGIAPDRISVASGLNNTEEQVEATRNYGITQNAEFIALKFHAPRVKDLVNQHGIRANIVDAESVILNYHKRITVKERLERMSATDVRIMGFSKVYLFETVARMATRLGKPGRAALSALRSALGKNGPTVTELHFVDSVKNYMKYSEEQMKIYQEKEARRLAKQNIVDFATV
jgi:hypothetical protein